MAPAVEEQTKAIHTSKQKVPTTHANVLINHVSAKQKNQLKRVALPKFDDPYAEREFRKQHLAAAFRFLAREGYDDASTAGHISVRDPVNPDTFWINPFAKSFKYMKVSDLVLVDEEGVVLPEGNQHCINAAGFAIHSAIHKARPDAVAAVHTHSTWGKAFSSLPYEGFDMITQDACRIYNDYAFYREFGGVVLDEAEGRRIAEALGDKSALILQNHGLLTVSNLTVDGAVSLFATVERLCHVQMIADQTAKAKGIDTIKIGDEEARFSHQVSSDEMRYISFQPYFEELMEETNGSFLK